MSNGIVLECTECGNDRDFTIRAGMGVGVEAMCDECYYIERWRND